MKIHTQPDQLGGVWANAAAVRHSPHEFTIDFLRCDFDDAGNVSQGTLVQRVNVSPLFVTQLIAALQDNWSKYADKAMPRELMDPFIVPGVDEAADVSTDDTTNEPTGTEPTGTEPTGTEPTGDGES